MYLLLHGCVGIYIECVCTRVCVCMRLCVGLRVNAGVCKWFCAYARICEYARVHKWQVCMRVHDCELVSSRAFFSRVSNNGDNRRLGKKR